MEDAGGQHRVGEGFRRFEHRVVTDPFEDRHLHAEVGGTWRMAFRNFTSGNSHSFGGEYLELTPHERIRYTDTFDDPNLPGVMHVTVTLREVSMGTEVHIEQSGIPALIPLEACYLGWQQSLAQLTKLVEPHIPD